MCRGNIVRSWSQKKKVCGECTFFARLTSGGREHFVAALGKASAEGAS